jgi:hypothetical protein
LYDNDNFSKYLEQKNQIQNCFLFGENSVHMLQRKKKRKKRKERKKETRRKKQEQNHI